MKLQSLLRFLHLGSSSTPVVMPSDKLQMYAAKERLSQRGDELEEVSDELTAMIKRLNRKTPVGTAPRKLKKRGIK